MQQPAEGHISLLGKMPVAAGCFFLQPICDFCFLFTTQGTDTVRHRAELSLTYTWSDDVCCVTDVPRDTRTSTHPRWGAHGRP